MWEFPKGAHDVCGLKYLGKFEQSNKGADIYHHVILTFATAHSIL